MDTTQIIEAVVQLIQQGGRAAIWIVCLIYGVSLIRFIIGCGTGVWITKMILELLKRLINCMDV